MLTIKELEEKARVLNVIRGKIKELTKIKEKCEEELEKELKNLGVDQKTFHLNDMIVTVAPTVLYSLNDEGLKLLNSIPYDESVWKKTPNFAEIRKDLRFNTKDVIVESYGKTKLTIKDSKEVLKEDVETANE